MNIYLVRHAHARWIPDENRPLSLQGLRDAARVADLLARLPIEVIISSPYKRAFQTVAVLASNLGLEIQIEEGLRERTLGNWSAASFDDAVGRTWQDAGFSWPNGESNSTAQARAIVAMESIISGSSVHHIVLATHGNLLALILNYYDQRVA